MIDPRRVAVTIRRILRVFCAAGRSKGAGLLNFAAARNQFNSFSLGSNSINGLWCADIDKNNKITIADISGFIILFNTWNIP